MASYKIIVEGRAEKELRKLPAAIRRRIVDAIDSLAHDPRPASSRKMVGSSGFRMRVGDYRVIYEIKDEIVSIFVIKIGHRREIYRR